MAYSSLSSSSSIDVAALPPPRALPDDDDRMGPDKRKNDVNRLPVPADAPSSLLPGAPPLLAAAPPPRPKPPLADPPLNAPNFAETAANFGEMTAEIRLCRLLIGTGASIPYCLFLAIFVASNDEMSRVLASRMLSIF